MRSVWKGTFFIFLLSLFLILPITSYADDSDQNQDSDKAFIDRDGDGFDDFLADEDANGIPDVSEAKVNEYSQQEQSPDAEQQTSSPFGSMNTFDLTIYMANSERFGKLSTACNAISGMRGGFDAGNDFGAGNGIGSGAVASGCPGGVCH